MSVPKALLGVAVGWVVWMATGVEERKGSGNKSGRGDLEAPAGESAGGTVVGCDALGPTRTATRRSRSDTPYRDFPDRMKRRSELAFCDGRIVEAAYWMAIASLHEGLDCSERMMDYVETWQAVGCPEGRELVHSGFTAAQCYFGWLVLCFHSGTELALAIAELDRMAKGGDTDARAFLEANGIGSGGVV